MKTSGHIAEIVKDRIYVVGGENLDNDKTFKENWYYDFKKNENPTSGGRDIGP